MIRPGKSNATCQSVAGVVPVFLIVMAPFIPDPQSPVTLNETWAAAVGLTGGDVGGLTGGDTGGETGGTVGGAASRATPLRTNPLAAVEEPRVAVNPNATAAGPSLVSRTWPWNPPPQSWVTAYRAWAAGTARSSNVSKARRAARESVRDMGSPFVH